MNRQTAEKKLKEVFGFPSFHDDQWKTIENVFQGKRVLLIEKTGFGKSLCYQFPATQFEGLTVIFSPLIALMRDQVNSLNAKGIKAAYINSEQDPEENTKAIAEAKVGRLKILYIAPERQENREWIEATREMPLSMVVIDEAHTISVWGHDFRPAFRRIVNLVNLLPKNMPVLATTATATERVQKDIETQISGDVQTIRGQLVRENFELYVIKVQSEEEKMAWLAEHFNEMEGNGIIYTGTRVNTHIYSMWLHELGYSSVEYNAGLDPQTRKEIEIGFMENRWKAVVSTNALGMGIDKPDIRFIIHTQMPASPIHYYQEIGRAGRDGKPSKLILFYNEKKDEKGIPKDVKLPLAFIDGGRPSINKYQKVIDALKQEPLGERQLMNKTNMKQQQIRVIKADLLDQGIVKEVYYGREKKYEYQFDAPELDTENFTELRRAKENELNAMQEYIDLETSRMTWLCDYLGDSVYTDTFRNCDNTDLSPLRTSAKEETFQRIDAFRENFFPELEVENRSNNLKNGVAASYYGFSNVGSVIHRCKYENGGDFPSHLIRLTLRAIRKSFGSKKFDLILYVPPTESGDLVKNFAMNLGKALNIPVSDNLIKSQETAPQKMFQNGWLKKENVKDKFTFTQANMISNKSILLIDDIFDSGATIKEIGKMLTQSGAAEIIPVVIAKTVGGDIG